MKRRKKRGNSIGTRCGFIAFLSVAGLVHKLACCGWEEAWCRYALEIDAAACEAVIS